MDRSERKQIMELKRKFVEMVYEMADLRDEPEGSRKVSMLRNKMSTTYDMIEALEHDSLADR